jgi:hypothetical protein
MARARSTAADGESDEDILETPMVANCIRPIK